MGGRALRLLLDDPDSLSAVRHLLADVVTDEPGEPAFRLHHPGAGERLHLVSDRCGIVLARCRSASDAHRIAARHVRAFGDIPVGGHRFRLRAVHHEDGVVLCLPPMMSTEPIIESRLVRHGLSMVDRLALDLDLDGAVIGRSGPGAVDSPHGHTDLAGRHRILGLVMFTPPSTPTPSGAAWCAAIASESIGGTREDALVAARAAVATAQTHVTTSIGGDVVDALVSAVGRHQPGG